MPKNEVGAGDLSEKGGCYMPLGWSPSSKSPDVAELTQRCLGSWLMCMVCHHDVRKIPASVLWLLEFRQGCKGYVEWT